MAWQQQIGAALYPRLQQALKTNHGRFSLVGLSIGLIYLPVWLGYLFPQAVRGKIGWFLIFSMLFLAGSELWNKRQTLGQLKASEEDRLLGYLLIASGVALFPFCRFAVWPQSLLWLMILIGIVCSTWGIEFFRRFMIPTFFVGLTVYPRIGLISRFVWELLFPDQLLEKVMAAIASAGMRIIGFPATQQGVFIAFPKGAVEVGWGCNGLDMAITIAAAGLFMGLLYKQKRTQMIWLISSAAIIALIANIPRLMLVTIAHVYWGEWWFHFWHGFWGGQIFSGILFTIYYYVVEALTKQQTGRPST
ncbi:MAG: cyanoexosortase C [Phormidesmis sp.]